MASEMWKIEWLLQKEFEKAARQFTREIGMEIEAAYEATWRDFIKVWSDWRNNRGGAKMDWQDSSSFMLQASDKYWEMGNSGKFGIDSNPDRTNYDPSESGFKIKANPDDNNYHADVTIDPKNIRQVLHSRWGRRKGRVYPNKKAFDMMFNQGIMGYNRDIVKRSWYKTKASQRRYYRKYHLKGITNPNRDLILRMVRDANVIPPTAKLKPYKNMQQRYNKITTKKHLDEKWGEIAGQIDQNIRKLIK